MNKKTAGISLVALVITIIVLIILTGTVIVTFMDGGIIDRAKESVFKNDIKTYQEILAVKNAERQIKISTGNGEDVPEITIADIPEFKDDEYGDLIEIKNGKFVAKKELDEEIKEEKWLIELGIKSGTGEDNGSEEEAGEDVEYTIGQEVSITDNEGVEHNFYVMADSGSTLTLLAKDNIKSVQFSKTNYWYKAGEYITYDLNDYEVVKAQEQEGKAYALEAAMEYGEKLGGEGRLMTYTEAESWEDEGDLQTKLYEAGNYWLGSASENADFAVWLVYGGRGNLTDYNYDRTYGVRPVITISETAINNNAL